MSVAIPIPLLQHLPDVNVTPAVGVDAYALVYDHDTARFVLRAPAAPFAGLLATGATVGATSQAQAFTLGVVSPFIAPAADSTTAVQVRKADKTAAIVTFDTTNGRVGIGTNAPATRFHIVGISEAPTGAYFGIIKIDTNSGANDTGFKMGALAGAGSAGYGFIQAVHTNVANDAILVLNPSGGFVGIGKTAPAALLHVDQSSTTGAVPVLTVDQADVSEEFIRFIGTSTTDASQSLVDAANMTTPGALAGWLKIYVQDDQATNPITNGTYYVPFYAAPTA